MTKKSLKIGLKLFESVFFLFQSYSVGPRMSGADGDICNSCLQPYNSKDRVPKVILLARKGSHMFLFSRYLLLLTYFLFNGNNDGDQILKSWNISQN